MNASSAGLSVAAVAALPACQTADNAQTNAAREVDFASDDFQFNEVTIETLQEQMANGSLSATVLTQAYLNRIAKLDQGGPKINAVIELNPDALYIAKEMDELRKTGKVLGPLHGLPVLIKDNINTGDKMQTTAGALALEGNVAKDDAFIIAKLRQAGAVLLGKTNLSEWANFRSTSSCSGWSSRGGQTKLPYVLTHNPCGSSAGSGAAVAANFCVVAIGTETDGSITCPASVNGLVGIKPTVGLWSRNGIIPISATQDTAGPMARTVTDAAILLGLLTGVDESDPVTKESANWANVNYVTGLDGKGLQGKRIGVDMGRKSKHHQLNAMLEESLDVMRKLGAEIVDVAYLDEVDKLADYEFKILQYEFKDGVNAYLKTANAPVKSLTEVITFNKENEDVAMPFFKQEQLEKCDTLEGLEAAEYQEALVKGRDASRKLLTDTITANRLNALSGLTMPPACAIDMLYGDRYSNDFLTAPAAMSGYPHITVPCGQVFGLPVGLSFFGGPYTEHALIKMAYTYEQATKKRVRPGFLAELSQAPMAEKG